MTTAKWTPDEFEVEFNITSWKWLILLRFRWFWCRSKAEIFSFLTAPKSRAGRKSLFWFYKIIDFDFPKKSKSKSFGIEIKTRSRRGLILLGFWRFLRQMKALNPSFYLTQKSSKSDQYKSTSWPRFDFDLKWFWFFGENQNQWFCKIKIMIFSQP